ncbi:hypothetical protein BKA61DRAFT_592693 [Leptodontidium sp. MPI-SDFR-AT-0119]|nr:hypothetical protein BKA61DRAFT_592693 [Leptodontidium sp. MPI-SDFR-AT-0119]
MREVHIPFLWVHSLWKAVMATDGRNLHSISPWGDGSGLRLVFADALSQELDPFSLLFYDETQYNRVKLGIGIV